MSALSVLLTEANTEALTAREISTRARKAGHSMNHDTAWKYMSGRHGKPTDPVLAAFADVLRLDITKLREAAGVPAVAQDWRPPAEAARLSRRELDALDELIRAMALQRDAAAAAITLARAGQPPPPRQNAETTGDQGATISAFPRSGRSDVHVQQAAELDTTPTDAELRAAREAEAEAAAAAEERRRQDESEGA